MRKKINIGIILFLIFCSNAKAQNWGGGVDDEQLNFGFSFQYISSEFKILKAKNWRTPYFDVVSGAQITDTLTAISSPTSAGFGIGFVVNYRLTNNIDLRLTPTMVFNDRLMKYDYQNSNVISKKVQATLMELPLGLKIKSDRWLNMRAYFLGGIKFSSDLISKKKTLNTGTIWQEQFLNNKRNFFSYETAIGFDF